MPKPAHSSSVTFYRIIITLLSIFTFYLTKRFGKLNVPSMKETIEYKYDQLFQQFGTEIVKVGRVNKKTESSYHFYIVCFNKVKFIRCCLSF